MRVTVAMVALILGAIVAAVVGGTVLLRARIARGAAAMTLGWLERETLPQLEAYRGESGFYPPTLLPDPDADFHPLSQVGRSTQGEWEHLPYGEWQAAPVAYAALSGSDGKPGQRFLLSVAKSAGGVGFPAGVLSVKFELDPHAWRGWL